MILAARANFTAKTLTLHAFTAVLALSATALPWTSAHAQTAVVAPVVHHAIGTFEVTVKALDPAQSEAGIGLSRFGLIKTFSGGLAGTGTGQMLAGDSSASPGGGIYVALERVVGKLDGREGAFLMVHRGDMAKQGYTLTIKVVPGSGTGALVGIEGDFVLTITGGVHHYDLAYTLPAG